MTTIFLNLLYRLKCAKIDVSFFLFLARQKCHFIFALFLTGESITKASCCNGSNLYPGVIRDVIVFLLENKYISTDFRPLVRRHKRAFPIPSVYTQEERKIIEGYPNTETAIGKRNKAMILLATRNGLREGNIIGLRLSDIDFSNDIMHLEQVKTHEAINPVLFPEVKAALRDYVENARPNTELDYVFITTVAPYTQMASGAVYNVISAAIIESGIEPNGRKLGPHGMRSSLTSSGINNGMTYEEMRIVNGHRDANAIKHYARLDDVNLRKCSLDVSDSSGSFKLFLQGGA